MPGGQERSANHRRSHIIPENGDLPRTHQTVRFVLSSVLTHENACLSAIVICRLTGETATSVTARVCTCRTGAFQTGSQMLVLVNRKCVSGLRVYAELGLGPEDAGGNPRSLRLRGFMRTWMCSAVSHDMRRQLHNIHGIYYTHGSSMHLEA